MDEQQQPQPPFESGGGDEVDIERLFEPGNEEALKAYLRLLQHPADVAELFHLVDESHWRQLTRYLSAETFAQVLRHLDEGQRGLLGEVLGAERLTEVIDELETDDAADVLADLPPDKADEVLKAIADRAEIELLLAYPTDSAGGIMQKEVCRVQRGANVRAAIEAVRRARERIEDILEVYVVDWAGRLRATLTLEDLVLSEDDVPIDTLSHAVEHVAYPEMDQEEVAQMFGKYDLFSLPVINQKGVLLGRITFDDIQDVVEEEASEDIMAMAGTSDEEFVYGTEFFRIAMFRLPWLVTAMLGSLATGFLLSLFDYFPGDAIVLAAFVPTVMAMTGNLGSQSAMIITRGLATGRVDLDTLGRSLVRELLVAFIMGAVVGGAVGLLAHVWKQHAVLGLAVGASIVASMTVAALVGVAAPALFKKIGIDPAIAAGPLVTTGCDLLGVGIYLLVALLLLS